MTVPVGINSVFKKFYSVITVSCDDDGALSQTPPRISQAIKCHCTGIIRLCGKIESINFLGAPSAENISEMLQFLELLHHAGKFGKSHIL